MAEQRGEGTKNRGGNEVERGNEVGRADEQTKGEAKTIEDGCRSAHAVKDVRLEKDELAHAGRRGRRETGEVKYAHAVKDARMAKDTCSCRARHESEKKTCSRRERSEIRGKVEFKDSLDESRHDTSCVSNSQLHPRARRSFPITR